MKNNSSSPYYLIRARFAHFDRDYLFDPIVSGISRGQPESGANRDNEGTVG